MFFNFGEQPRTEKISYKILYRFYIFFLKSKHKCALRIGFIDIWFTLWTMKTEDTDVLKVFYFNTQKSKDPFHLEQFFSVIESLAILLLRFNFSWMLDVVWLTTGQCMFVLMSNIDFSFFLREDFVIWKSFERGAPQKLFNQEVQNFKPLDDRSIHPSKCSL